MMMEQKDLNILLNKVLEVMEAKKECAAAMEEEASAAAGKTEGKTKGFITITVLLCICLRAPPRHLLSGPTRALPSFRLRLLRPPAPSPTSPEAAQTTLEATAELSSRHRRREIWARCGTAGRFPPPGAPQRRRRPPRALAMAATDLPTLAMAVADLPHPRHGRRRHTHTGHLPPPATRRCRAPEHDVLEREREEGSRRRGWPASGHQAELRLDASGSEAAAGGGGPGAAARSGGCARPRKLRPAAGARERRPAARAVRACASCGRLRGRGSGARRRGPCELVQAAAGGGGRGRLHGRLPPTRCRGAGGAVTSERSSDEVERSRRPAVGCGCQ
ncbi:hypothetical protein PVAP13_1KG086631 [Panicum virgatum]|uniref:Uncharacterized protein n=1 Tax=Panicum virgatum TaxID=38727 RepID=A0A8T0XCM7_PANVG|nr:hypothetical protein PVAP13_1KG086631 [Panicum virgatum]